MTIDHSDVATTGLRMGPAEVMQRLGGWRRSRPGAEFISGQSQFISRQRQIWLDEQEHIFIWQRRARYAAGSKLWVLARSALDLVLTSRWRASADILVPLRPAPMISSK